MKDIKLKLDLLRYGELNKMPLFWKFYRKTNSHKKNIIYSVMFKIAKYFNHIELSSNTKIGNGIYIGHPYDITINPEVVIGNNVNIHKGVTIGRENRGNREGCPCIGDDVWIGINAVIVGKITIGNDVLIAPNSYVNTDIPSHSIVLGNPAIVKHSDNATKGYIENRISV